MTGRRDERRRAPRSRVTAAVRVIFEDREYYFDTRDISTLGVFLYSDQLHALPFSVGVPVRVELFPSPTVTVKFYGEVARLVEVGTQEAEQYPTGFAVMITRIDDENRRLLEQLVESGGREKAVDGADAQPLLSPLLRQLLSHPGDG